MNSYRFALLVDNLESEYVASLKESILSYCQDNAIQLFVFPVRKLVKNDWKYDYQYAATISLIHKQNFDGVLFAANTQMSCMSVEELSEFSKSFAPLPVVSISCPLQDIPSVVSDFRTGLEELTNHLVKKHRCKKFAFIAAIPDSTESNDRLEVVRSVLKKNKIILPDSNVLYGNYIYSDTFDALENYCAQNKKLDFDAILCANDNMAYACIDFLKMYDYDVPGDILVTGFDDLPRASYSSPSLTTVSMDVKQNGKLAAEILHKKVQGIEVPLLTEVKSYAVFRQSCKCVRVNKEYMDAGGKGGFSWSDKKRQLHKISAFLSETQEEIELKTLHREIKHILSSYGMNDATICLYDEPVEVLEFEKFHLPKSAYVLCSFNTDKDYDFYRNNLEIEHFNPQIRMLPENMAELITDEHIVFPLFICKNQYGYLIYRGTAFDVEIYQILCRLLSSLIASAVVMTRKNLKMEDLNEMSVTDELTHIMNRRGFMSSGGRMLNMAKELNSGGLVIFGDMDGLKIINDTYGHEAGDRAIIAESKILKSLFRTSDIVARLGGDEFAVIALGMTAAQFAEEQNKLEKKCEEFNSSSGESFTLSISIGYAIIQSDSSLEMLLKQADQRQYEQKRLKKAAKLQ